MLNRIIRFSLANRLIVLLASAIILIGGVIATLRTEVDIFPDLNAPMVTIMTEAPGMATEEVEQLVTYPIEVAVNGAQGVDAVRSSSGTGLSVVTVVFNDNIDPYIARQIIAERLTQLEGQLPPAADSPVIGPQSSILGEILIVGLTSDTLSLAEMRTIADRTLRPALLAVGGVSSVSVIGGDEIEYQILLDQGLMKHFGVTLQQVSEALADMNTNAQGSVIDSYGSEYVVKGDVSTVSPDELSCVVIESGDSQSAAVTLADIATIRTAAAQPKIGLASVKGKPAVILTVTKQPGTGTINLTERLLQVIDDQSKSLPQSLEISTDIFAQRDFIDRSISSLSVSLFEGALMVIIVLFFFMMNVRATLVSLIALPMSIIITLILFRCMGITVNTMSLGGIAIAIGSLVDDAIVDVENVSKRLKEAIRRGGRLSPRDMISTVYEASKEVRMPIFNSTLIIITGFTPLFFLSGVEGRMLIPLGIAFIVALAASTIVALTLTPVICSFLLPKSIAKKLSRVDSIEEANPWAARKLGAAYGKWLQSALRQPKVWLISVAVLFVLSIVAAVTLGRGFLPPFNEGSFTINISALPGLSLTESDRVGRMAEELIMSVPEINTVARKTGRAELDEHSRGSNMSEIEAPYTLAGRSRSEVAAELREKLKVIPGVSIELGQPISHRIDAMLSGTEAPVVFKVYGTDLDRLNSIAHRIKGIMHQTGKLEDITVEQQIDRPEITIKPRRAIMARYSITPQQFSDVVSTALSGKVVSTVYDEGYPRSLRLKFMPAADGREPIDALGDILLDTPKGKVPLSEIAEIRSTSGPNAINRENASRRVVVSANIESGDVATVVKEVTEAINREISLPQGYTIVEAGQAGTATAATLRLLWASLLAVIVIFVLLYYEFRDLRQSLLILINMPLAAIGGFFALFLTGLPLNIPAIIGFIALLGIATRNGMLLISRYNALMSDGLTLREAVGQGSSDRLMPIIMTALTSALALIPLALRGASPGNEIQAPLAIVLLGGLVSSTLLNLFVTPILFIKSNRKKE